MQASYPQNTGPSVEMLGATLREALLPSMRETAAESLATMDCRDNVPVVNTLLNSARHDPCPSVRACCVRTLVKLQVNGVNMRLAMEELRNDKDPSVRQQATQALETVSWQTSSR
jgi:hypothetical protein